MYMVGLVENHFIIIIKKYELLSRQKWEKTYKILDGW